jgi:hypothetical protein
MLRLRPRRRNHLLRSARSSRLLPLGITRDDPPPSQCGGGFRWSYPQSAIISDKIRFHLVGLAPSRRGSGEQDFAPMSDQVSCYKVQGLFPQGPQGISWPRTPVSTRGHDGRPMFFPAFRSHFKVFILRLAQRSTIRALAVQLL